MENVEINFLNICEVMNIEVILINEEVEIGIKFV